MSYSTNPMDDRVISPEMPVVECGSCGVVLVKEEERTPGFCSKHMPGGPVLSRCRVCQVPLVKMEDIGNRKCGLHAPGSLYDQQKMEDDKG